MTETDDLDMFVTKRNGKIEVLSYKKILQRTKKLGSQFNLTLNYSSLVMKIMDQLYNNIKTSEIDELMCQTCASLGSTDYDYYKLASALCISNHQKEVSTDFIENYKKIFNEDSGYLSKEFVDIVNKHKDYFISMIDYSRDYEIDYFGFKTLERAYLMRHNKVIYERIQHMWLRVAVQIHGEDLEKITESYDALSQKYFIHATPTLFNSGTKRPQLSSCYLIGMENDSIDGIFNTLHDCASISKWAGGIGLHIHNIRAKGTSIIGTNGTSNGLVPMLRVFNNTARYVDQCVLPETLIYTTNGIKEIQNIQPGIDMIYNEKGQIETVQNVLEHAYNGEMYVIDTMHNFGSLTISPEHPVLCVQGQKKGINYNIIKNRLEKGLTNIDYFEAKEIDENTMIGYKIPSYYSDVAHINEDDCFMYGLMLGDGFMSNKNKTASITMHSINKKNSIEFVKDYLSSKCIHYTLSDNNNENGLTTKLIWTRGVDFPFHYSELYNENKEKRISEKFLNLPLHKTAQIVKGLIYSDGCIHKEIAFDNTSKELIDQFQFLLLKMGVLSSGTIRNRIGETHYIRENETITNKKISYSVRVPRTSEICDLLNIDEPENAFVKFFKYNDYLFTRVTQINTIHYDGILYDLQMKEEHNYMLQQGIVHNGGGKRSGSFAMYLEPWHADIEDFMELRKNHGDEESRARDLFYALWIPDLFMKRVNDDDYWYLMCPNECKGLSDTYGDEFETLYNSYVEKGKYRKKMKARELWFQILDSQMETGTPYMLYKDASNKKSNQKNLGTIKSSNLCVAPETLVLTDEGHIRIETLCDKNVNVWNGESWSNVVVRKTGIDQELMSIYTSDGGKLDCTPYHKFYIKESYDSQMKEVQASDLKLNDKLIKCQYPIIDGNKTMNYAYTHGFFCGDGTYGNVNKNTTETQCKYKALQGHHFCKRHICNETSNYIENINEDDVHTMCQAKCYEPKPMIYLYSEKRKLLNHMEYRSQTENNERIALMLPTDIDKKFVVPDHDCKLQTKLNWFAGLCDADGCISKNNDNKQLQVASINKDFLNDVRLMLQTCGINGKVTLCMKRDKSLLPDGRGGTKEYNVQTIYRLLISSCDLFHLKNIGFVPLRLDISDLHEPQRNCKQFVKINKIEINNRFDDTYCFTEPKRHMGIFNGILTGQCTEIIEYSDDKETAVCNLASISLSAMVNEETRTFDLNKLQQVTETVTENLNKIIDKNFYPTIKTYRSNMNHRPIGIGVQGLADAFAKMDIPFDSDIAQSLNKDIFETIYYGSMKKSNELSIQRKEKMYLLQQEFIFDLYKNLDGYYEWFVPLFNENYYNKEFVYYNQEEDPTLNSKIQDNITNLYHEMKPTMKELFGYSFYDQLKEFFDKQFNLYKYKYEKYEELRVDYKDELRKPEHCGAYSSFEGSPLSEGIFQFDMWNTAPSNKYNWNSLRESMIKYGARNSLCLAPMPTASTSQILANNECFEPFTSNIYTRRTLAGEFVVINKYLLQEMKQLGLWNVSMKNKVIEQKGSIQNIDEIPDKIKKKYKIVWDMSMKRLIDMAKERGAFICQSQSMNLWIEDPNYNNLTKMHFYSWRSGLKTGIYYLRRKAKHQAQQFTIEPTKNMSSDNTKSQEEEHEVCEMCSG